MFKLPKPEFDRPGEGSSPEHPIVLKGVAATDFVALLTVLYASQFSSDQSTPDILLLIPAFPLANMFNFSKLRAYLLSFAEGHLDDVEKIVFAKEFDITEWLAPAHIRLCQRLEPLSEEEAGKLGVGSVLIISRMREQHRTRISGMHSSRYYCYTCSGMSYYNNGFTCNGCSGAQGPGYLRYNGLGRLAQTASPTVDYAAIRAGVQK